MLHPHRTGHVPVVLVHGTASSPARWAELINELENDPRFWHDYEIWFFIYNTGNPIAYSASLLRDALTKAIADLDPEGKDPGLKQMVVIGHSQGGLLAKMTVIDTGMHLWPFTVSPNELDVSAETRETLTHALIIKPLPFVKRVIFVATPHRGSYQALGFLGSLVSWLVNLPGRLTKTKRRLLDSSEAGSIPRFSERHTDRHRQHEPEQYFYQKFSGHPDCGGGYSKFNYSCGQRRAAR